MKVSVLMTTYNHERFIAQAIDSVLMQKVNFDYEIVIGEDCSKDNTRNILIDYQEKHPDIIRLLLHERNLGLYGKYNFIETYKACRGQYIAMLEGDDYWTSPHKLQKQVDFLDRHPECSICFHSVIRLCEDKSHESYVFSPRDKKEIYTLEDLLDKYLIAAASMMFRKGLFGDFPSWFYLTAMGDWALNILNAQHGKIGYINEVMGVWRIHSGGFWSSKGLIERLQEEIKAYRFVNSHLNFRYNRLIRSKVSRDYLRIAEEYKQRDDRVNALINLARSTRKSPYNLSISYLRLFLMILELSLPKLYNRLRDFKNKYSTW